MADNEKQFEIDIEASLTSAEGGWQKATDAGYRAGIQVDSMGVFQENYALDIETLCAFVKATQPVAWALFEKRCKSDPQKKFYKAFQNAVDMNGLVNVLRHGFKHRGQEFKVIYFKPETELNQVSLANYGKNICQCIRQWHYTHKNKNSVDMMLAVNGIPLVAIELKDQLTGQNVDNAITQWMTDRDPREDAFQFNRRILIYFAVDLYRVAMTTRLQGTKTWFLPFNQGSNGPGVDGGAGNPQNPDGGYVTAYLWEDVLQKDRFLDILQKFISYQKETKKTVMPDGKTQINVTEKIIFPRYHQLDVVRKLVAHTKENGPGHNYLIQHSAGSGKSNSIAWTAYRLASLHDEMNKPVFASVIIVTDRTVLDRQLQDTISSFDHTLGTVETYNAACAAGEDTAFGKKPEYLDPIGEGPYYTIQVKTEILNTFGGLCVTMQTLSVISPSLEKRRYLYGKLVQCIISMTLFASAILIKTRRWLSPIPISIVSALILMKLVVKRSRFSRRIHV